jgi:hypothetical protein
MTFSLSLAISLAPLCFALSPPGYSPSCQIEVDAPALVLLDQPAAVAESMVGEAVRPVAGAVGYLVLIEQILRALSLSES